MERTIEKLQCWTKGRRSTAVVEDLRPRATVLFVVFLVFFSKMEAEIQGLLSFHYTGATCLWIKLI